MACRTCGQAWTADSGEDIADNLPTGEAAVLKELLEWVRDRPLWMQEAMRQLLRQEELTESSLAYLVALCRDPTGEVEPISEDDISAVAASGTPIKLTSLSDLVNINALAERQTLTFAPNGMTVIYGDNGSGKSGYVRVLKHACRTRGKIPEILPDLTNIGADVEEAAKIQFSCSGVDST